MLPSLTALSLRDLSLLDEYRVERFRAFFAQDLRTSILYLSRLDCTLVISGGSSVRALLDDSTHLLGEAWAILSVTRVKIYVDNELIADLNQRSCNKLKLKDQDKHPTMATAVITETNADSISSVERPIAERPTNSTAPHAKIVKSLALTDIAADLETEVDALEVFLTEHNTTLIDFRGTLLVSEDEAAIAYEHYSLIRARQKMQERFSTRSPIQDLAPSKDTTPKESKPKKPTLTFKKSFKVNRSNYKRTMQNFLEAMFPDSPEQQRQVLSDILQPNELGSAYLDKIVRAGDYKDKQHARNLLYKAAAELSSGETAVPKEDGQEAPL